MLQAIGRRPVDGKKADAGLGKKVQHDRRVRGDDEERRIEPALAQGQGRIGAAQRREQDGGTVELDVGKQFGTRRTKPPRSRGRVRSAGKGGIQSPRPVGVSARRGQAGLEAFVAI